jgi:hypothetical protein
VAEAPAHAAASNSEAPPIQNSAFHHAAGATVAS